MKRKTKEEFSSQLSSLVGTEYTLCSDYVNNSTKVILRHSRCGQTFAITPNNFLKGRRCPHCNKMRHKTEEELRAQIRQKNHSMYLLDGYTTVNKPARFYHMDCGRIFEATPASILAGKHCPFCYDSTTGKSERFQNDLNERFGGRIFLLEQFKGMSTPCMFRCGKCGNSFIAKPKTLTRFVRCPICADEDPKTKIERFLDVAGFQYDRNYNVYESCMLKFDFYIKELNIAIDYNGKFYYNNIKGIKPLNDEKGKKKIKDGYCKTHKIKLLRIPFWKYDKIDEILYDMFMEIDAKSSMTKFNLWRQSQHLGSYKQWKKENSIDKRFVKKYSKQ